jgi:orotate phosphoribosyltransferase
MDRRQLASAIFTSSHLTGQFTLRSGATSGEYFDKYRFEADPPLLRAIAQAMASMLPDGTDVLAGLELGGVPLAVMLGQVTGIPTAFVRKQAKPYGTMRVSEGAEVDGARVVVIEDVITSGGQVVASTGRPAGARRHRRARAVRDRSRGRWGRRARGDRGVAAPALPDVRAEGGRARVSCGPSGRRRPGVPSARLSGRPRRGWP